MADLSAAPLGCARGSRASAPTGSAATRAPGLVDDARLVIGDVLPSLDVLAPSLDDVLLSLDDVLLALVDVLLSLDVDVLLSLDVLMLALELNALVVDIVALVVDGAALVVLVVAVGGGDAGTQRVLSGGAIGYWTASATCVAASARPNTSAAPAMCLRTTRQQRATKLHPPELHHVRPSDESILRMRRPA